MKRLLLLLLTLPLASPAQPPPLPPPYQPTPEEYQRIRERIPALEKALQNLPARHDLTADVEIYLKAVQFILRHPEEFATKECVAQTLAALDKGVQRATELRAGKPSWVSQKGRVVRAYRSRVDGGVQPYALVIPDSYDGAKPVRLDVVLHGRQDRMNEVNFIALQDAGRPPPTTQDFIQLNIYGRGNNAYHWAGETDVFEALASVQERYKIDPQRIVLRGFSMGGAGAWHLGLQHPDRWVAMEAGAGNTRSRRYADPGALPPHQKAALTIHEGMLDWAVNVANLPTVGYGGEEDRQLQASVNVREQLMKEGYGFVQDGWRWTPKDLRALFLVGPKTGHSVHPDSKKEIDAFLNEAVTRGRQTPDHIRFVTYTTRYNHCYWVTVDGLEQHYQRAEVEAQRSPTGVTVKTVNVARLILADSPREVTLDGQKFTRASVFEKKNGHWTASKSDDATLRKRHSLQGPIDDAFQDPFLCVRPTGTPAHAAAGEFAQKALEDFERTFAKFLRGALRVKDDTAVTKEDIANYHLILFGDPYSNKLIASTVTKLPLRWTKDTITLGPHEFSSQDHIPVLIYPNPLNPQRYIVLNTGHTFAPRDWRGSDYGLPTLGDYSVVKTTGEPAEAGLFTERWLLPTEPRP